MLSSTPRWAPMHTSTPLVCTVLPHAEPHSFAVWCFCCCFCLLCAYGRGTMPLRRPIACSREACLMMFCCGTFIHRYIHVLVFKRSHPNYSHMRSQSHMDTFLDRHGLVTLHWNACTCTLTRTLHCRSHGPQGHAQDGVVPCSGSRRRAGTLLLHNRDELALPFHRCRHGEQASHVSALGFKSGSAPACSTCFSLLKALL